MNTDQLLSGENGSVDIGSQLPDITSSITSMLMPVIILSFVLTIIFVAVYISSILRRRKVENAILTMEKILHEMNERDKTRSRPTPAPLSEPRTSDGAIIARTTHVS